jgi:protocatechuate 3,4-dioxygenase beta subunit
MMALLSRRWALQAIPLAGFAVFHRSTLAATASCGEATVSNQEGPYFKPKSPARASLLETSIIGQKLVVEGRVLSTDCQAIPGVILDFWQADSEGRYDNAGFRLRGHQFTDKDGRFRLETVFPGLYPGRPRHIHVKAAAPGGHILTTQLYFPGQAANARDRLYRDSLLMDVAGDPGQARFDFVLKSD